MKLLSIKTNKTKTQPIQNIKRTLQGVKTVGYLAIEGRNKVLTTKGQPRIFKSKTGRKLALTSIKAKTKVNKYANKLFNQCFVQSGILESAVSRAKKALKDAKKQMLSTIEYFNLHVNLCKSYLHLRTFKMSLPKNIVNFLF